MHDPAPSAPLSERTEGAVAPGGTPALAEWQFNDIHGYTAPNGARLIHQITHAELWVRGGRLVRGTGYQSASRDSRHQLARAGAILRLRQRRRYYIHAAGAVDPSATRMASHRPDRQRQIHARLRAGPQGMADPRRRRCHRGSTGRTGPVIAYQWREPLRISKGLIAEFPELEAGTRHARMLPGDPRERAEVPVRGTRSAPVAALVWLQQGPVDEIHRSRPPRRWWSSCNSLHGS